RSSGKMGYAIARAAAARGATVTLVSGPTALPAPLGVDMVRIDSAEELGEAPRLDLRRNPDVLAALGKRQFAGRRPILVGFAAETDNLERGARAKLLTKGCDLVVANDVSA